jgi:hypothetical protein
MSERGRAWLGAAALVAAASVACGGPEKTVVDQYFNAVKAKDNQTLSSFAAVSFDRPVDVWKISNVGPEEESAAPLPELVAKVKEIEAQQAANKKAAGTYSLQRYSDIEKVQDIRKRNGSVPAGLAAVATQWDEYNQKDRDLRKALAAAKDAVEKERRNVRLSVGDVEGVEGLQGKMLSKKVEVDITVKDEKPQPYVMTLRKYELQREGPRVNARWVVQAIQPKA